MSTATHFWLRDETKPFEKRTPLTPDNAKKLLDAGYSVTVEESNDRCFSVDQYKEVGCEIVPSMSWVDAPEDTVILGLKEHPDSDTFPLVHDHIMFAHCFKEQEGWQNVVRRHKEGKHTLYDLEFLKHDNGRRIAAFGSAAGLAGCALGIKYWALAQQARISGGGKVPTDVLTNVQSYESHDVMIEDLQKELQIVKKAAEDNNSDLATIPTVMIMGALGRCGSGAKQVCQTVGIPDEQIIAWDMEETKEGGPFNKILEADIFVNCIYLREHIPPFLTEQMIQENQEQRKLSLIVDVSCDTSNPHNPLPFCTKGTDFEHPSYRLDDLSTDSLELDVIAIDHLPTILPAESSIGYGEDFIKYLIDFDNDQEGVWKRAKETYEYWRDQVE